MTVRELLSRIDSHELTEWRAIEELEPFGSRGDDKRIGVVAQTLVNANRNTERRPEPYGLPDIFPWVEPPLRHNKPVEGTVSDLMAAFRTGAKPQ
jgi:hypothetical protein